MNTVTFVDEGRRFVTTSDDKTIRVWELGIPVQVRQLAAARSMCLLVWSVAVCVIQRCTASTICTALSSSLHALQATFGGHQP